MGTHLFAAYWNGNPEIVQFLLEKGASVTAASKNGQTPVQMIGSRDRSSDIIKRKKEIFENWLKLHPAVPHTPVPTYTGTLNQIK